MKNRINKESIERRLIEQGWMNENATILLIKKDCVVTEIYTGKTYSYRVINYVSGEQKYLFHKKQAIKSDQEEVIEKKIDVFESYGKNYPKSEIEMIRFIFEVVFKSFGFSIRSEQVDLSLQMYQAMIDGKISLSDVPVGLGKTHAYLVAAIVQRCYKEEYYLSKPIIITTSSIELQRAIVKDYLPEISKMLFIFGIIKSPITSVIRKGKDNYLCDQRLRNYIQNVDPKKKKVDEIITLRKIEELEEIDLDEIQGVSQYDRKRICVNYNSCQMCLQKNTCRYQRFMRNVKKPNIHIQVCNHNYYLADVIRRSKGLSALLPDHDVTVIDEAHKLMDAARQMYGSSISQREIYMLAKRTIPKKIKSKESRQLKYLGEEIIKYSIYMFKELVDNIPKHIDRDETEKFETVLSSVGRVHLSKLVANIEEIIRMSNLADKRYVSELRRTVRDLKVFQNWGIIYWIEKPYLNGQSVFASIPIALSKELGFDLWKTDGSKILTSGTLAVNNDFGYIGNELGLKAVAPGRLNQLSKESPFNYKENCLLHIPENVPYPSNINDKYLIKIANKIEELVRASNGHAMVLFTSYKPLKVVYEKLKHRLSDYEMILMSRGKKDSINKFKKTKNGVLFATGSAWEGINIPGDLLSHLIIVKLPFPIPDPISEYERTMYSTMDDYIDAVIVPKMLIKLRQGVGRLIRKETDSGVISILDTRASKCGKYRSQVIEALPDCKLVTGKEEIQEFYNRKKDLDFFE
jgi:ATP-dependent DNA helicase DinG